MKIINIKKTVTLEQLFEPLKQQLNPRFHEQSDSPLNFVITNTGDAIEISEPEVYGVLYHLELEGQELHITRSEHYTDDVNSLAVESVMYEIIGEVGDGADMVVEG